MVEEVGIQGRLEGDSHMVENSLRISILCCLLATAGASGQSEPEGEMQVIQDLEYARVGETALKLDLYLPAGQKHLPLLIWVHGGGWQRGHKGPQPLKWLGAHGYALASIDYRLSGSAVFPAQIHDCKAAVRWLRANAARYGYDPERIGAVGGHLVALLGTSAGVAELDGHVGQYLTTSTEVQAVVDYFGPTDFLLDVRTGAEKPHVIPEPVRRLFGGKPVEKRQLAELASPSGFVTPDDPPILIIHGEEDEVVSIEQSVYLDSLYRQEGLHSRLIRVPGQGHTGALMEDPEIRIRLASFLDEHLKGAHSQDGLLN